MTDTAPDAGSSPGTDPRSPSRQEQDRAFERHALARLPDVARFALSLTHAAPDADDLVQETYLRAYRAWHTFLPGSDCRRWLFTICKHVFLQLQSRERRAVQLEHDAELDTLAAVMLHVGAQGDGTDDLFDRLDIAPAIRDALAALPASFRMVVVLVDVEGYSYDDAAAVLEVPVGTVRSRLFRGRRLLQESLFAVARDAGIGTRTAAGNPARGPTAGAPDHRRDP